MSPTHTSNTSRLPADSVQLPVYLILSASNRSQVETELVPEQQRWKQVRRNGKEVEWQIVVKDADRSLNRTYLPVREISDIRLDWRSRGSWFLALSFTHHSFTSPGSTYVAFFSPNDVCPLAWLKVETKIYMNWKKGTSFYLSTKKFPVFCALAAFWPFFYQSSSECTNL